MKKIYWFLFLSGFLLLLSPGISAQCTTTYPDPPGYTTLQLRDRNVLKVDANGHPWIGFRLIGVGIFDSTNWTFYNRSNSGLPSNNVLSIAFLGSDAWIGTDSGLVKFDGTTWTLFNTSNSGILSNRVRRLFVDGGDLWIAFTSGLQMFDGMSWVTYNTGNGLANDTVRCFTKAGTSLFFGTRSGLSEWNGSSWTNYHIPSDLGVDNITSLATDSGGTLFIFSSNDLFNGNLFYKTGPDIKSVKAELPLFYSIFIDAKLFPSVTGSVLSLGGSNSNDFRTNIAEYTANPVTCTLYGCTSNLNLITGDTNDAVDCSSAGIIWSMAKFAGPLISVDYLANADTLNLPSDYGELNINKVKARLYNDGDLFWDRIGTAQYQVPSGQQKTPIFCHSLWIGGLDAGGNLHFTGQTYRQSGSDFWPGPVDTVSGQADSISSSLYDKIWVVDRWQINDFISNYNAGNVANGTYNIPDVIRTWPGNGNGNFSTQMAPFVDVSVDGIYDPYDGDYPEIRGDQMAWWVMNDTLHSHTETGGRAFGMEIHVSAYAYSCPLTADSDSVINYTTFYSYDIINRSSTNYHNIFLGTFTDVDLGYFNDDFVGCDVDHDFGYGYNGDPLDEGDQGYGPLPPVIDVALLSGPLADPVDGIDNDHDGIIDEPGETCMMNHFRYYWSDFTSWGNPVTPRDYYYYMHSLAKDSTHVTYGGYGTSGTIPCNYYFPGSSDSNYYGTSGIPVPPWTEYTAAGAPGDRRFIMTSGPFSLASGESRKMDYAIVYSRNENAVIYPDDALAKNLSDVLKVKGWWNSGVFPSACNTSIGTRDLTMPLTYSVYPNPFENSFDVLLPGNHNRVSYDILDFTGRVLAHGEIKSVKATIEMTGLARGMYFVRLRDENRSATAKLVRN